MGGWFGQLPQLFRQLSLIFCSGLAASCVLRFPSTLLLVFLNLRWVSRAFEPTTGTFA